MLSVVLFSLFASPAFGAVISARDTLLRRDALPAYALTYAPYAYLYSGEGYWPSDISTHLEHTVPEVGFASIGVTPTVASLNSVPTTAFLTSKDDPNADSSPAWLTSVANKPDASGYSLAPATIIAVEKAGGIVDVFYFYFYSFDLGNKVLGIRFGNHVGDWEHSMVRFTNGVPSHVYLSAHSGGSSYTYAGISKKDVRPIVYIGTGTHANYATAGQQDYSLPFGLLHDTTDAGVLWDVAKNYRGFWWDGSAFSTAGGADLGASEEVVEGASWLSWLGRWGDEQYPDSDPRQYGIFGQYHYVSGPTGPLDKNLGRVNVCPDDTCDILTSTLLKENASEDGEDGIVYDEYLDEFNAFKADLLARNVSTS